MTGWADRRLGAAGVGRPGIDDTMEAVMSDSSKQADNDNDSSMTTLLYELNRRLGSIEAKLQEHGDKLDEQVAATEEMTDKMEELIQLVVYGSDGLGDDRE